MCRARNDILICIKTNNSGEGYVFKGMGCEGNTARGYLHSDFTRDKLPLIFVDTVDDVP